MAPYLRELRLYDADSDTDSSPIRALAQCTQLQRLYVSLDIYLDQAFDVADVPSLRKLGITFTAEDAARFAARPHDLASLLTRICDWRQLEKVVIAEVGWHPAFNKLVSVDLSWLRQLSWIEPEEETRRRFHYGTGGIVSHRGVRKSEMTESSIPRFHGMHHAAIGAFMNGGPLIDVEEDDAEEDDDSSVEDEI